MGLSNNLENKIVLKTYWKDQLICMWIRLTVFQYHLEESGLDATEESRSDPFSTILGVTKYFGSFRSVLEGKLGK